MMLHRSVQAHSGHTPLSTFFPPILPFFHHLRDIFDIYNVFLLFLFFLLASRTAGLRFGLGPPFSLYINACRLYSTTSTSQKSRRINESRRLRWYSNLSPTRARQIIQIKSEKILFFQENSFF